MTPQGQDRYRMTGRVAMLKRMKQHTAHPNLMQWIWYTFGGKLGPRYREWVLHDTTSHRWLRQIVRGVVQVVLPAAVVLAVVLAVLGDSWVIWAGVACGMLLAQWYSLAYIDQTADRRLVKHGYEPGTLERVLQERHRLEHADEIARYMQIWRHQGVDRP